MNPIANELAELAKQTREHLNAHFKPQDFIPSSSESCAYFKPKAEPQASPYPFKPKEPDEPSERPPVTPKPPLPPIQRPLPPPARKLPQPPPTGPEQPKKKSETQTAGFVLEPMAEVLPADFGDMRSLYSARFPKNLILEKPLDDTDFQQPTNESESVCVYPEVALLSFSGNPKLLAFLQNLARAIHMKWNVRADVIAAHQWEQEKAWEGLLAHSKTRLILASDYGLQTLPDLMKHYKEAPRQGHHFLGTKPLLLLSDITIYLREPHLKLPLWQAISMQLTPK